MAVTCFSSTGAISFEPVAPRIQAVGPIEVAIAPSPPDETVAAPENHAAGMAPCYRTVLLVALLSGAGAMLLAL